jgi:hypothetical protein
VWALLCFWENFEIGLVDGVPSAASYLPLKLNKQASHYMLAQASALQDDGYNTIN